MKNSINMMSGHAYGRLIRLTLAEFAQKLDAYYEMSQETTSVTHQVQQPPQIIWTINNTNSITLNDDHWISSTTIATHGYCNNSNWSYTPTITTDSTSINGNVTVPSIQYQWKTNKSVGSVKFMNSMLNSKVFLWIEDGIWLHGSAISDMIYGENPKQFDFYFSSHAKYLKLSRLIKKFAKKINGGYIHNDVIFYLHKGKYFDTMDAIVNETAISSLAIAFDGKEIAANGFDEYNGNFSLFTYDPFISRKEIVSQIEQLIEKGQTFNVCLTDLYYLVCGLTWNEIKKRWSLCVLYDDPEMKIFNNINLQKAIIEEASANGQSLVDFIISESNGNIPKGNVMDLLLSFLDQPVYNNGNNILPIQRAAITYKLMEEKKDVTDKKKRKNNRTGYAITG